MAQPLFNTLAYTDRLKAAGFSDEQARGQASALELALSESVATKADIQELKATIQGDIQGMKIWFLSLMAGQTFVILGLVFGMLKAFRP